MKRTGPGLSTMIMITTKSSNSIKKIARLKPTYIAFFRASCVLIHALSRVTALECAKLVLLEANNFLMSKNYIAGRIAGYWA